MSSASKKTHDGLAISLIASAQLLWVVGRLPDALNRAQTAVESYNRYVGYPPQVVKAFLLMKEGKVNEAINLYEQVMKSYPYFHDLKSEMIRARMEPVLANAQDDQKPTFDKELVESIEDAIVLDPKKAYPWFLMGYVRSLQGDYDAAVEAYKNAVEGEPNNAGLHVYLAYSYKKTNQDDKQEEEIKKARGMVEESEGAYKYHRACLEAVDDHPAEALSLLEEALEQNTRV